MRSRYEVWRYSNSWGKWIRDIYPDLDEANKRYEFLQQRGKKARPPRPFNHGLPLTDRVEYMVSKVIRRVSRSSGLRSRMGS